MLRQRNGEKKRSQYFFVVLETKLDCEFLQIGSKRNNSFSGIKKAAMLFMKSTAAFSGKHGSFLFKRFPCRQFIRIIVRIAIAAGLFLLRVDRKHEHKPTIRDGAKRLGAHVCQVQVRQSGSPVNPCGLLPVVIQSQQERPHQFPTGFFRVRLGLVIPLVRPGQERAFVCWLVHSLHRVHAALDMGHYAANRLVQAVVMVQELIDREDIVHSEKGRILFFMA